MVHAHMGADTLELVIGDITAQATDAIANAANKLVQRGKLHIFPLFFHSDSTFHNI